MTRLEASRDLKEIIAKTGSWHPANMSSSFPTEWISVDVVFDPASANNGTTEAVDLLAVPGFGLDADQTWTSEGVSWLSDSTMLPFWTPTCRIIKSTYSLKWIGDETVQKKISQIADGLLRKVVALRKAHPMRPLIFVGHCFGGLVIQKAVLLAKLHEEEYPLLSKCVVGAMFLGTPQKDTPGQERTALLAAIASATGHGPSDALAVSLEREKDALSDLQQEFTRIANIHSIPIHCFFEQFGWDRCDSLNDLSRSTMSQNSLFFRPIPGSFVRSREPSPPPEQPSFRVDSEAGSIDGSPSHCLSTDHFGLVKFSHPEDENYILIRSELVKLIESAKECVTKRLKETTRENDQCLNALFSTDPLDDMEMIEHKNGTILEGSSSWLPENSVYAEWKNDPSSRVLWMSGEPGKGKTMLAISIIKQLLEEIGSNTSTPDVLLAYYFCDNKDNRRTTCVAVIRSLLYQIFTQRPDLCAPFKALYDREGDQLLTSPTALRSLWRLLKSSIHGNRIKRVYLIIDGLDELDVESAEDLLKLMEPFLDPDPEMSHFKSTNGPKPKSDVKWLLTSRSYDYIAGPLRNTLNVSLEANSSHVKSNVWRFIDDKVNELQKLKKYDTALATYVRDTLREKSEGTFLYVSMACRELSKHGVRLINTKSTLNKFPLGLTPLYERIFSQITAGQEDDMIAFAMAILRCMVLSLRPLTIQELAISAELPKEYHDDENLLYDYVSLCGAFISRHGETLHFVHETVKAYLLSLTDVFNEPMAMYHARLAQTFLGHIDERSTAQHGFQSDLTLLEYPVSFWLHHGKLAESNLQWSNCLTSKLFSNSPQTRRQWLDSYWSQNHQEWDKRPVEMTSLQVAAYGGVLHLVQALIIRGDDANEADSNGHTPLIWAARNGHDVVTNFLLQHGAHCESKTTDGITSLVWATINGHHQVVQTLIKSGANIQVVDSMGWTPLHHAAAHGNVAILRTLLAAGADVDAKDISQQTAIQRATYCDKICIIQVLIENKADLSVRDKDGLTLLHLAVRYAHLDLAKFWLELTDDLEARDDQGWTPLMHAAWFGHSAIVACLVDSGAHPEAKSADGNTSLHLATWNGHADVVNVLLKANADPNSACHNHETPLQQAAWLGYLTVCQLLLKAGVDPNSKSVTGVTPLHQAAANGHEVVAKLLLEWGANPNAVDSFKQTPSGRAVENNHHTIAKLLQTLEDDHNNQLLGQEDDSEETSDFETVDPAVCEVLQVPQESCIAQSHGTIGFSKPTKVTALINGVATHYFMKSGLTGEMFATEHTALRTLHSIVPTIVPYSLGHGKFANSDHSFLLMEFIDTAYRSESTHHNAMSLPQKLAKLHTTPAPIPEGYKQPMFGWPTPTYCGSTQQSNTFCSSWGKFYSENRLLSSLRNIDEAHGTDQELRAGVEAIVQKVVPRLLGNGHLGGRRGITPVLVHGDLWIGNRCKGKIASWSGSEEVTFDPSVCYAHSEFELGIMRMFGGFSAGFFHEYHRIVPKTEPKEEYEDRIKLYQLYQYLNHYLIFRGGYKDDAIDLMNGLIQKYAESD